MKENLFLKGERGAPGVPGIPGLQGEQGNPGYCPVKIVSKMAAWLARKKEPLS
jgi:hypothetical protein